MGGGAGLRPEDRRGPPRRRAPRPGGHPRLSGRGGGRGPAARSGRRCGGQALMLAVENLHSGYGRIQALHGVDVNVGRGEIVTLIGANGAGKTTLLMTICGKPRASQGRVLLDGQDITRLPMHRIARLGLAHSPEGRRIFPRMSVLENLQMGAVVADPKHYADDLERVLALFPRLKERLPQRGGTLSGGEQQMLAIGRALMSRPRVLLLDEPSLGLAPLVVRHIFEPDRPGQPRTGRHRLPGGAERLSCPEAGPSRLCHGQRPCHPVGQRRRTAGQQGDPRPLPGRRSDRNMIDSLPVFIGITVLFMGGCAFMAGQALAATWRPLWQVFPYALALAAGDRFLCFALFGGRLLSLPGYLTDAAVLLAITLAAYRLTQARRMVSQYPWLYRRNGLFGWTARG
ncbi:MAG: ABC transporter ATP-binding protein [Magnetospirillum sp.]|nr:ABC transporter ATP-binding protein [Magnetospirillum sp.]